MRSIYTGLCLLMLATVARAHHSFAMFDQSKIWRWNAATVVEYEWQNPHVHIIVDVPAEGNDPMTVGRWDFESESTAQAIRQGWTRKTLSPGDRITLVGHPTKDRQQKGAQGEYVILPGGTVLYFANSHTITPDTPLKP